MMDEETSQKNTVIPRTGNLCTSSEEDAKKTRHRKRKRALHSSIRSQIEFYFSDANLSKDRFMQSAIKDEPEVPISVFMTFNRVKSITEDICEVQKALEHSTVLKLSEDKCKVSRIIPFQPRSQEEEDQCTIYVEHLPVAADIDWVSNVFKEFGEVAYVSLPKYKDGRNKGFAFVEFKQPDCAIEAVKAYSATSAYEALVQDPGQLCSIRAFSEDQAAAPNGDDTTIKKESTEHEENEANEESQPQAKKPRLEEDSSNSINDTNKGNEDEGPKAKRTKLAQDETVENSAETLAGSSDQAKQEQSEAVASIKKKKKKKKKASQRESAELSYEAQTLPLQVMSKKEWKKLRNKYLTMQRKCLRQLRMNAFRHHSYHKHDYEYEESQNGEEHAESHQNVEVKVEHGVEFDTGLIVKITLDEPIVDAKRFKSQVRSQDGVSYVEAQDGSISAFVRCNDSAAAKSLVQKNIWHQTYILEGNEEKEYWQKIEDNRLKKRDKSTKQKKTGNRSNKQSESTFKLPSKAAQHKGLHIRFDDEIAEDSTSTKEES